MGLEPLIIRGGAIVHRTAIAGKRGQERWITELLASLGCPILFTIHGSAIHETRGNVVFLDPKHAIQATSVRSNMEGVRQIEPVLREAGVEEFHVANLPSYWDSMDRQGVRLGELHTVATTHGYEELERWSRGLAEIHACGIEGTGSYGAGVARFLTSRGHTVVEVNRPDRSTRYRKGKSDPTDAEMAARAVLAGVADATPKSGEGEVEMIRMFKSTKDSAVKARTQAINQMKALVVTGPGPAS